MTKRAAAVARTRSRIIEATLELHGEQGIAATSWEDIAERAGVGVGTVYRHFPSLDELVPACGDVAMATVSLPKPAEVAALFDGSDDPGARLERLVSEVFAIYERGAEVLRVLRRESHMHARVNRERKRFERAIDSLVDMALAPLSVGPERRAVVRALVDLGTWEALRAQNLETEAASVEIARLLAAAESP